MIQEHPTWWKYHATKLDDYLTCPRYSFYKTFVGWQRVQTHNHRDFGKAWHELMETLLKEGYTTEALANGMQRFMTTYRKAFAAETDALFTPKTPSTALTAAAYYIREYADKDAQQEILHTEACGAVPISRNRLIRFKIDSILRDARGVFSREHKTGSRGGRQFIYNFPFSMQFCTYTHVLYFLYPSNEVWGVEINGTIFQKAKIDFIRVPCRASLPMLNAWLCDINSWIDRLEADVATLMVADKEDAPVMQSFPRNPLSCTDFYGCEYHPFCLSWANPLQHLDDGPPIGFYQEYWDPEAAEEGKEDLGVLA